MAVFKHLYNLLSVFFIRHPVIFIFISHYPITILPPFIIPLIFQLLPIQLLFYLVRYFLSYNFPIFHISIAIIISLFRQYGGAKVIGSRIDPIFPTYAYRSLGLFVVFAVRSWMKRKLSWSCLLRKIREALPLTCLQRVILIQLRVYALLALIIVTTAVCK